MHESKLTAKGQTTLPRDVRDRLGLKPGDRLRYVLLDGGEVRLLPARPLAGLAGRLAAPGRRATLARIEEAIAEGAGDEAG